VTYVHRSGNCIGVALGIGLSDCDINKCYDADTGKFLPEPAKTMIELGRQGYTDRPNPAGVTLLASRLSDYPWVGNICPNYSAR
jgi:hypothetical protein